MNDGGLKAISGAISVMINGLVLGGMAFAGFLGESEAALDRPLDYVEVEVQPLPALGKEPEPKALPRIVAPPPPPEPEADEVSLSRQRKEEEIEKKKEEERKQREIAEEKRRKDEEEKKLLEEERKREKKEERERKKAMQRALQRVEDNRADEDSPDGFKDGNPNGTSTDPNALRERSAYVSLVELVLSRQFPEMGTIPPDERKRLVATVSFRIDDSGTVQGTPRLVKPSGNTLYDQEAIRTVMKFSGGGLKIPVPKPEQRDLRNFVLAKGISARMRAK